MERLTKRGNDSVVRYKKDGLFLEPCEIPSYGDIKTILDRLAYYEDMEEQGRLVVLPKSDSNLCKDNALCCDDNCQSCANRIYKAYRKAREEAENAMKGGAGNGDRHY